jgi:nitroreductase
VSIRNLVAPGPDPVQVRRIISAAAAAPDHGRLVPFRFVEITEPSRQRLAAAHEAATRDLLPEPTDIDLQKARDRALKGPWLMALIACLQPQHPKIVIGDQWLAVGCALQNILLATEAEGLSAGIVSGPALDTGVMRAFFNLKPDERVVSFVTIGTPVERPDPRRKPPLDDVFQQI